MYHPHLPQIQRAAPTRKLGNDFNQLAAVSCSNTVVLAEDLKSLPVMGHYDSERETCLNAPLLGVQW